MKRFSLSLLSGLLVSLALFWLMQFMIRNNQQGFKKTDNLQMTEFVRLKRESKLKTKEREIPDEPPPEKRPPPPPQMQVQQTQVTSVPLQKMDVPVLDIPFESSRFSGAGSVISGVQMGRGKVSTNVIPLVRIPPRYPMRAARRKIEGWVKVEFTITEQGTVKAPEVVESQPSDIFDQAALRAIGKWKFKAKIIDGEAFEQRAIQVLQFKLTK